MPRSVLFLGGPIDKQRHEVPTPLGDRFQVIESPEPIPVGQLVCDDNPLIRVVTYHHKRVAFDRRIYDLYLADDADWRDAEGLLAPPYGTPKPPRPWERWRRR